MIELSFIIPAHNVEKSIQKTIDSIINIGSKSFEIILVDDQSTDNTFAICQENAKKYSFIKVYQTPMSKGYAGQPRNIAIDNAVGEFICFMDPDDFYIGSGINEAYQLYNEYDMIVNSYVVGNENDTDLGYRFTGHYTLPVQEYDYNKNFHDKFKGVCFQRMMIKRSFLKENNIRYIEHLPSQDSIILFDILKMKPKVIMTNLMTTCYICNREGSVTNSFNEKKVLLGLEAINEIYVRINECDFNDSEKNILKNKYINWYIEKISPYLDNENIVNEIKKYPFYHYYRRRLEQ